MTVLVTGASGFLGRHLVDLLLASDQRPRVLVAPHEREEIIAPLELDVRRADIADPEAVSVAMRGIDRVLHCAAQTGASAPVEAYEHANVRGLEVMMHAAMAADVRRVVHLSSIAVNGSDVRGAADETTPLRPDRDPYSRSKYAGERLLARMVHQRRVPLTIVRPGWIYGPGDRVSFIRLAQRIESGRMVTVGTGENHIPLIYVADVARGVLLASEAPRAEGRCYVLVNDERVTQREFLTAIARELGAPDRMPHVPYRLAQTLGLLAETAARLHSGAGTPLTRYGVRLLGGENRFSIERARRELGFEPQVGMTEGVARSVGWYRNMARHGPMTTEVGV